MKRDKKKFESEAYVHCYHPDIKDNYACGGRPTKHNTFTLNPEEATCPDCRLVMTREYDIVKHVRKQTVEFREQLADEIEDYCYIKRINRTHTSINDLLKYLRSKEF